MTAIKSFNLEVNVESSKKLKRFGKCSSYARAEIQQRDFPKKHPLSESPNLCNSY